MAICKKCGKKGLFLKLDDGLCSDCHTEAIRQQRLRIEHEHKISNDRKVLVSDILKQYGEIKPRFTSVPYEKIIENRTSILEKLDNIVDAPEYNQALIDVVMEEGKHDGSRFYSLHSIYIWYNSQTGKPDEKNYLRDFYSTVKKELEDAELEQNNLLAFIDLKNDIEYVNIDLSDEKVARNRLSDMPEIKLSNLTVRTNRSSLFKYIALDIETTGLKTRESEIIEIAAIRFEDFEPVECFSTFIKPRKEIPASATQINGITNDMVKNAPEIHNIIPALQNYLANYPIVGHNVSFDLKFLFSYGVDFFKIKRKYFDTLPLYKKFNPDSYNYKLDTICSNVKIIRPDTHRALDDAIATGILFQSLVDEICK